MILAMIDLDVQYRRPSFKLMAKWSGKGFIGLTGPNGSGKTTLMHLIGGVINPTEGVVKINGRDITQVPLNQRRAVYLNVECYFSHLCVDAHLAWGTSSQEASLLQPRINEVKKALGIAYYGKVGELSLGQRARVIMGTVLIHQPSVILVDEVFANISNREGTIGKVKEIASSFGADVMFSTQDASDLKLADSVLEMDDGILRTTS